MTVSPEQKTQASDLPGAATNQKRFARNIRWQFVANGSQAIFGGTYLVVLGRFLGTEEFGKFSAITALVSVIGALLEMRLQDVIARDFCRIDDGANGSTSAAPYLIDLFLLETASRVAPLVVIIIISESLVRTINLAPNSAGFLNLAASAFFLSKSGSSVSTGLLRVLSRTDLIAGGMALDWGLRLVVTSTFALFSHLGIGLALWISLVAGAFCNGALVFLAYREFVSRVAPIRITNWSLSGGINRTKVARRLIFSNLGVSAADLMAKDFDVTLIASLLTPDKVGIYKMAKSFVQVIWRAIDPFYISLMPEVQKLWQTNQLTKLACFLRKISLQLLLFSTTLVGVGNLTLSLLNERLLGASYAGVPGLVFAMSAWLVVCAPLIWGSPLAVAINRPELSTIGSVVGLLIGLFTYSMLTPTYGLVGAAIAWNATLISGFSFTAATSLWILRQINTDRHIEGHSDEY
jgi:O-antigen/teichoic acid export membrane protein